MRSVQIEVSNLKSAGEIARLLRTDGWEPQSAVDSCTDAAADRTAVHVCDAEAADLLRAKASRMVVVADSAEEALRTALRLGAPEAVAWPGERKLLLAAVVSASRPHRRRGAGSGKRAGGRVGFVSVRSCGTTALVAHVASALAHKSVNAFLIDCDLDYSDLTGYLIDGDPEGSLSEAVSQRLTLADAAVESKGVRFIPSSAPSDAKGTAPGEIAAWIQSDGAPGDAIVLFDLPSRSLVGDGTSLAERIEMLDLTVVLVPLDFMGIRRARIVIDSWPGGIDEKVRLLLVQRRRHGIAAADALEALGCLHFGVLPMGGEALDEALDQGRLLGARPGTPYGRAVDALAEQVIAEALGKVPTATIRTPGERRHAKVNAVLGIVNGRRREVASA